MVRNSLSKLISTRRSTVPYPKILDQGGSDLLLQPHKLSTPTCYAIKKFKSARPRGRARTIEIPKTGSIEQSREERTSGASGTQPIAVCPKVVKILFEQKCSTTKLFPSFLTFNCIVEGVTEKGYKKRLVSRINPNLSLKIIL